ncbi:pentatricopeptide repeat-containing protein At3g24000, mitochondrial [Ricinus communis]|uniref:pentatricopeptide repeat-containing protein At3g24000, mitochondrial n=1 Tax=Ricinus communis TaxID=3988 RepID=UPI00201B30FA|nr:pentatricopeptide repeat-containing protein At3g24000, mitochondrial [Ricinus communis]XP_015571629.2 pentatricopeptide repeat-containing protein At3g24000, mitochondrial [Ricinus communis]XP_015571630.2 pentatricopeptide repeat-containing protein At3g24000, mitochondrial [Ricinus communis]XP_015571631.2 pentatricopeptide repeat-containing protein At3g24000, mitochondrial [Ricinus communis]
MEFDFIALKMRVSSPAFQCFFLPNRPTYISSMKLYNNFHSSSASVRVRFSGCTADTAQEVNKRIPRKLSSPNWSLIDKSETNEIISFASKEVLKRYSGMLRECASKGNLNEGTAIHGNVIKSGLEPDSHLWVSLINLYAKCGSLAFARKVLVGMRERDVVSWTALIAGYVSEGCGSDGVKAYCEMRKENICPNEFTLATVLKASSMCSDIKFGKLIHLEAIKTGLLLDLFVGSALVDLYAKFGEMELADRVFFGMPEKNNVSWNALLNGYAQRGDGKSVLKLFCRMLECEMNFTNYTLSTVLKGCANSGNLREGKALHSLSIRRAYELDEFLGCNLVDMYSKCGMAYEALKVFNMIEEPDIVAWSAIITGLDQQGHSQEAAELFHLMRQKGVRPNQFSFASVISAATNVGDLYLGQSIHCCICKYGYESDNSVGNALITMYMKSGFVQDGIRVFDTMTNRDLVSWNALLSGFYDFETSDQGLRIFCQMLMEGLVPNLYTFVGVLRSCSSLLNVWFGKQVHAHIIKNSLDGNDFVGTALIDMYAKNRCLEDADVAFNKLTNRDLFTWTVIIAGHSQTDKAEKAVKYLGQMLREGIKPNEFTLASCLSGCSRMATLGNGQQLHSLAIKSGHSGDVFVSSALVDMYGKCGCMEDAEAIFKGLFSRDTVAWNTIICGYSQHGQGQKALEAFRMMLDEDIDPDEVTFIGVLAACSYMGWVEEGKKHFDLMSKVYGITPSIEHHACMVDILGRTGKFNEVEVFIEEKKLAPYSLIWETVLGACKLHGNVEFGKQAAEKLFEFEPKMDSSYILLSNIFAAKGRWDNVRSTRAMMSTQGVKKEPGCSWIEVNGQVHVFTSQDGSHPKSMEIYTKLEELGQKLTSIGYTPKTENVLHNVSNKEKKELLYHHSERLALAFALISTSPVKPIRIFKNLRICGDCHDFMKLMSSITNREIVVRDIKRFHHFKKGTCTCQDYW